MRITCVLMIFFCLLVCLGWGQEVSVHLSGKVVNVQDEPLENAEVSVINTDTGVNRKAGTGADGRFLIPSLPVGPYSLTVSKQTYVTVSNVSLNLVLGYAAPLIVKMEPEAEAEMELVYLQHVPVIPGRSRDPQRTSFATLVYPEAVTSLPIKGRSFLDFSYLTPQVIVSSPSDRALIAISGQRGVNTSINIDGSEYNEPFFHGTMGHAEGRTPFSLSIEAIRQFQIVTDGAPAEIGRTGGGYVNAITRSGSNDFHAGFFFYDRPQGLVAKEFQSKTVSDFKTHQFGGFVSGPLIKYRLFYFIAFDGQEDSRPVNFVWGGARPVILDPNNSRDAVLAARGSSYTIPANARTLFARTDWHISPQQTLQVRLNLSRFNSHVNAGPTTTFEDTASDNVNTLSVVGHWTRYVGSEWMNELRMNYTTDDLPREARSESPQVVISNVGNYGKYPFIREFNTHRYQITEMLSYLRPTFRFKVGSDLNFTGVDEIFNPFINGAYTFNNLDDFRKGNWATYTQNFGLSGLSRSESGALKTSEWEVALFGQMEWQLRDNFRLSAGLRMDHQDHPDFPIADFKNPLSYPVPLTARIPAATSLSPRFGITWTPGFDEGRTLIRAGAGAYVSRTPAVFLYQVYTLNGRRIGAYTFSGSNPADVAAAAALGVLRGDGFNADDPASLTGAPTGPAAVSDLFTFSPDFKNPRAHRISIGAERDFGGGLFLGLAAAYAKTTHLERIQDINLSVPVLNAQGRLVFTTARPNTNYRRMAYFTSDAEGRYWAITMNTSYRKEGSRFATELFYTYSEERDNDSNERSFSFSATQNPQRLDDEYSWSDKDRRHVITGYATYLEPFSRIRIGAKFQYLSGLPYSLTNPSDLNRDGVRGNDRMLGTYRNQFHAGSIALVDLKLSREFTMNPIRIIPSLEVYNLLNRQNTYDTLRFTGTDVAPVSTHVETPLYTVNSIYFPTRQVQWGIRIEY